MATQTKPIHGKIAKVLNSREVALNIGQAQGVAPGMRFEVLAPQAYEIPDPDTGIVLGSVALPKVPVEITRVYDHVSVAATYRKQSVDIRVISHPSDIFKPPLWERRYETLKTGGGFAKDTIDLDPADSYVAIGDPVVQVIDEPA